MEYVSRQVKKSILDFLASSVIFFKNWFDKFIADG